MSMVRQPAVISKETLRICAPPCRSLGIINLLVSSCPEFAFHGKSGPGIRKLPIVDDGPNPSHFQRLAAAGNGGTSLYRASSCSDCAFRTGTSQPAERLWQQPSQPAFQNWWRSAVHSQRYTQRRPVRTHLWPHRHLRKDLAKPTRPHAIRVR